jgi:hypothetical protein
MAQIKKPEGADAARRAGHIRRRSRCGSGVDHRSASFGVYGPKKKKAPLIQSDINPDYVLGAMAHMPVSKTDRIGYQPAAETYPTRCASQSVCAGCRLSLIVVATALDPDILAAG